MLMKVVCSEKCYHTIHWFIQMKKISKETAIFITCANFTGTHRLKLVVEGKPQNP
jgi:hypothetical protein